jgi:hypothetical protein
LTAKLGDSEAQASVTTWTGGAYEQEVLLSTVKVAQEDAIVWIVCAIYPTKLQLVLAVQAMW